MPNQNGVLILTWKEIDELLDMKEVILSVESAFKEKGAGKVQMPPKIYLNFERYIGDLRSMPAYLETADIAGVKIVNVHLKNKSIGLPSVMATIELIDPKNGKPLAILDGTKITSYRTGAASAVATKYLARKDSKVLGVIGAGTQSRTQVEAISKVTTLEKIYVYDIDRRASERLSEYIKEKGIASKVNIESKIQNVASEADILTTLTPSKAPILFLKWLKSGVHINAIGADAPGKQELDPEILKMGKIVVDDLEQTLHSGEINVPISKGMMNKEDIYAELGEIVVGKKIGRTSDSEITIFDSTGLAILDVAVGNLIYQKAIKYKVGTTLDLIDILIDIYS
ncbi:MAG: alanine dehydrogenase [Nitrososphaeria archaeon]